MKQSWNRLQGLTQLVTLLLLGCFTVLGAPLKVACVGDSITAGSGSITNYPTRLGKLLGTNYVVTDYGVSGTTMLKDGDFPYWNTASFTNSQNAAPNIVVIMLGTNDSKSQNWVHSAEFLADYEAMIAIYTNLPSHPTVYINTPPTVSNTGNYGITDPVVTGDVTPLVEQAAQAMGCHLTDVNAATKNMPQNFPDNVHPDDDGAELIAEAVSFTLTGVAYGALNRAGWVASASVGSGPANVLDGNVDTRWTTDASQTNGQWFQMDMGSAKTFNKIVLYSGKSVNDYPRGYQVNVSTDGVNWGSPVATGVGAPTTTPITFPTKTDRYIRVTQTGSASGVWWSIHEFNVYALPSPWQNQDIGSVGLAGSCTFFPSTFTLAGSGADIQGTADAFQYVYQSSSADCSMVAKVLSITNTSAWAKAGVMIRETTAPGSINAGMFVTPSNGITFQWRTNTSGSTSYVSQGGLVAPYWVKLSRTGNAFASYYSTNGTAWTQMGTAQTFPMASSATIGLAVTAHNNASLCTAPINNVTASP